MRHKDFLNDIAAFLDEARPEAVKAFREKLLEQPPIVKRLLECEKEEENVAWFEAQPDSAAVIQAWGRDVVEAAIGWLGAQLTVYKEMEKLNAVCFFEVMDRFGEATQDVKELLTRYDHRHLFLQVPGGFDVRYYANAKGRYDRLYAYTVYARGNKLMAMRYDRKQVELVLLPVPEPIPA